MAQNNARTREILDAWATCPDGARYPGCARWKNEKVFEQTAFNEYVRYDFTGEDDIKPLPCDETDGYPGSPDLCAGELVRHFWREKGRVKEGIVGALGRVMEAWLEGLREGFWERRDLLYVEE